LNAIRKHTIYETSTRHCINIAKIFQKASRE